MKRLVADRVDLGYRQRPVLADVSLTPLPGEIVALIGPNGAGKTTLLRALARQLRPKAGTVSLDESDAWSLPPESVARHVALTLQTSGADRPITVRESVALGRAPHRGWLLPFRPEDRLAIEKSLERVDLLAFADRPVTELSDGEAQRVALARALAQQPDVLLVDEPTAHLDLRYQGEILDQLAALAAEGLAVVAALHDLNLAAVWADRLALVSQGKLVAFGSAEEVLTAETLSAAYETPLTVSRHPEWGTPLVMPMPRNPRSTAFPGRTN